MNEGLWIPVVMFIVTGTNVLPTSVALVGLVALMAWVFQDEVTAIG